MKIQIIGTGIVGEATACLASNLGHQVFGYDKREMKSGFYTNGLVKDAELVFICVNETVVQDVVDELICKGVGGLYVIRSSVPPLTTELLSSKYNRHFCHHPEFLFEKSYLDDALNPRVVMLGICCPKHGKLLQGFYSGMTVPIVECTPRYTELAKLQLNVYRASLITFWNNVDVIASTLNIDTNLLCKIMKMEGRINNCGCDFFGQPFGGKCLPKDLTQVIDLCKRLHLDVEFYRGIRCFNNKLAECSVK